MEQKLLELFPDELVPVRNFTSFVNQPERIQISSQEDISDYDQNTLTTYYNFRVPLPRPALNVKSIQLARANIPNIVPNIPDTQTTFWYYALPKESAGFIYPDAGGAPGPTASYSFDVSGNLYTQPGNVRVRSGIIYTSDTTGTEVYTFNSAGQIFPYAGGGAIAGASITFSNPAILTLPFFNTGTYTFPLNFAEATANSSPQLYTPVTSVTRGQVEYYLTFEQNQIYFDSGNLAIAADINSPYVYNIEDAVSQSPTAVPATYDDPPITEYWISYTAPTLGQLRTNYLRYIRLVPSTTAPELMNNFTGGFNKIFADFDDLLVEVNDATTDDPLNGETLNNVLGTFRFVQNQIAFDVDGQFTKFVFTGLDQRFSYIPAAAGDFLWEVAAVVLRLRDSLNTRFAASLQGINKIEQPFEPYKNLNLRLGFTYATYPQGNNFLSMIRPLPPLIASPPPLSFGAFTAYDHVAPGYADLVNTACVHIYTDITGGSTVDSIVNKALLGSVPLNTTTLGVGFHSLPLNNPLTKIPQQINEIYIEMRNDTGQPFYIGNNGVVSLELILTY